MTSFPLADELFLIGHDDYSGKTQCDAAVLEAGLAGAVLGELVLSRRIDVADGTVVPRDRQDSRGEAVSDTAFAEIVKQPGGHPVRDWVAYLREGARPAVGRRLVGAGLVEQVRGRGLLRQTLRFVATDPMKASSPRVRLRYMVDRPELLDEHTAILAGLVLATGLDGVVAAGASRPIRDSLRGMVSRLPPDLRAVAGGVEAVVAGLGAPARR
jgi:hypothetical protein